MPKFKKNTNPAVKSGFKMEGPSGKGLEVLPTAFRKGNTGDRMRGLGWKDVLSPTHFMASMAGVGAPGSGGSRGRGINRGSGPLAGGKNTITARESGGPTPGGWNRNSLFGGGGGGGGGLGGAIASNIGGFGGGGGLGLPFMKKGKVMKNKK